MIQMIARGKLKADRRIAVGSLEQHSRQSGGASALDEELRRRERDKQLSATVAALIGIAPKDELEGMMAAQLVAAHNAAMECYRRAMIGEQTFEGRRENLPRPTSCPAPMRRCSKPSTAIAARASRRSRSSMSTSMRAGRRWSAWSEATGGWGRRKIGGTTPCKADCPCT